MLKHLVPQIPLNQLLAVLKFTAIGTLIAGGYGIVHDQVTYTIGPEYFHNFKFYQFAYADFGLGDRVFVACIGFLATWWVGLFVGWILSRRVLSHQAGAAATRQIMCGFAIVFVSGLTAGVIGWLYGLYRGPSADYSAWHDVLRALKVTDTWSFMRVAYIHNASYLGGFIGFVLTYFLIRPAQTAPS